MKNRNISNLKYYILGALFVVTAIITFVTMNYQSASYSSTIMTQATLPIVTMQTESGMQFNRLHGYTREMDGILSNYTLTPLSRDKKLPINIHTYGQAVTAISYKVRDLSDRSLIENTKVTDFTVDGENVSAQLNIKNLIDDNKQYLLQVIVATEKHETISYYTKIISGQDYLIDDKLNFVLDYNKATFSPELIGSITKYLETTASGNTNNFGEINIHCNQTLLSWGNLDPFVQSDIIPSIQDINSETAIITLDYSMGAKNDHESYDSYNVNEYFRIRQSDTTMYLLNYERNANQIFDSRNDLTTSSKINLGITSNTNVVYQESPNKNYLYFVNQGTLWCFNSTNNEFSQVFSFTADESDNTREAYAKHDFKIIEVNDQGDCQFLLDGYMNRGAHEGEVGVSLYNYSYSQNVVEEKAYIPLDAPYDMVRDTVGDLAYVKDNNIFYILINNNMYAVDLTSKEVMTEISDLKNDTFAVSPSRKAIAYSTNGNLYHTDAIRIFDVSKTSDYVIKADEGDSLRVVGYINDDFVYGVAHNSDVVEDANGNTIFPMYKLCIINPSYEEIKKYELDNIYITDAQVNKFRVNLTRVSKDASGKYQNATNDQVLNKDENADNTEASVDTFTSDKRLQETLLVLSKAIKNTNTVSMRSSKEVVFKGNSVIELNQKNTEMSRYYVYGYGLFQGSYTRVTDAIKKANSSSGYVVDSDNKVLWNKYRGSSGSVKGVTLAGGSSNSLATAVEALLKFDGHQVDVAAKLSQGSTAIDIMNENMDQHGLMLQGTTLDNVLYYISAGYPVIAKLSSGTYGIITAYDNTSLVYINTESGSVETKSISDATTMFAQNGNVFISYYK